MALTAWCAPTGLRFLVLVLCFAAMDPAAAAAREDWYLASRNHVEAGLGVLLVTRADGSRWVRVLDLAMLEIDSSGAVRSSHSGEAIVAVDSLAIGLVLDPLGGRAHFLDRSAAHLPDLGSTELLLDTTVNRQLVGEPQLVLVRDGELLLSPGSLEAVGATQLPATRIDGHVPVHALAGELFVVDPQQMRLELTLAPERFATTKLSAPARQLPSAGMTPAPLAAIVGYDANASRDQDGNLHQALLVDAAVSSGRFGCRSRHLWRSSEGADRLDTSCTIDWPERALSLGVGDGASRSSALTAPVRYAGVRIGTDYALQPYLYTQPVLELDGVARLPSVLEVWIEQQLALRTELPPGPFSLNDIPLLSGAGDVNAVIVDALGRRTVVSQPFYSDPVLLRPGLNDWAVELGHPRSGFGDADYGDPFALASLRRGMNERLTVELRGEWRAAGHVVGAAGFVNLGGFGVLELAAASSASDGGHGLARALGYTWRGGRWGVGARHVQRDAGYTDIAWPVPGTAPRRESRLGAALRVGVASLSVTGVSQEAGDGREHALATAGMTVPVGNGYLSLSATRTQRPVRDARYGATYTLPLSARDSVSARSGYDDGGITGGVQFQRSAPPGPGYGVRATIERRAGGTSASVDTVVRGSHAQVDASIYHDGEATSARVGAAGAVVVTREGVFTAPDHGGSFALVTVPAPDARILHDNQVVSVTDSKGRALLSGVRSFERNRVAVQVEDLPLSTRIATPELEIVPGRRQVARADFDAASVRYLAAELRRPDGTLVPVGATARVGEASFPIGHDGLLFAELGDVAVDIVVQWQGQPLCLVAAAQVPTDPDPADTHPLSCEDSRHAP